MSEQEPSQNLSEILFKPKFKYPETSLISNSGAPLPELKLPQEELEQLGYAEGWYRPLYPISWVLLGGSYYDISDALYRIANSPVEERSRPACRDTSNDYGPGHWVYEFNAEAQERCNAAKDYEEQGNFEKAAHNYRMATRYFAIAAYPNLKGDTLAAEAYMHALLNYRKIFECKSKIKGPEVAEETADTDSELRSIKLTVETITTKDGKITGYLHLPADSVPHACVIICGSYESSVTDFYRLYVRMLRPHKIGALMIELPGIGLSDKLTLGPEISVTVDAAREFLEQDRRIDASQIGLMGVGLGATACLRSACMREEKIKAQVLIGPSVDSVFTDKSVLSSLPLCLRSIYSNRLGSDAVDWDTIAPQLQVMSLKKQGLMSMSGGSDCPTLLITYGDYPTSKSDAKLIRNHFPKSEQVEMEHHSHSLFYEEAYQTATQFFVSNFA